MTNSLAPRSPFLKRYVSFVTFEMTAKFDGSAASQAEHSGDTPKFISITLSSERRSHCVPHPLILQRRRGAAVEQGPRALGRRSLQLLLFSRQLTIAYFKCVVTKQASVTLRRKNTSRKKKYNPKSIHVFSMAEASRTPAKK